MDSVFSSVRSLTQIFDGKMQEFISDIENVHMIWLEEIQQEANRMFSSDFSTEPELMPKTPSQKKSSRRKRISVGYQEENHMKRRFSKGKRSKLRDSSVRKLDLIDEDKSVPEATTCEMPKRSTRRNKQIQAEDSADAAMQPPLSSRKTKQSGDLNKDQKVVVADEGANQQSEVNRTGTTGELDSSDPDLSNIAHGSAKMALPEVALKLSTAERTTAEMAVKPEVSPGRSATRIAIAGPANASQRSSVRVSLKLRHSLAGLRHSMTQDSVRRASRRSMLKKRAGMGNSICSSADNFMENEEQVEDIRDTVPTVEPLDTMAEAGATDPEAALEQNQGLTQANQRHSNNTTLCPVTRSMAVNSSKMTPPGLLPDGNVSKTPPKSSLRSHQNAKRKAPDLSEESPTKRSSPPKKTQSAIRPNMRSFLHTVQKNQLLMMAPTSLGRSNVMKSFIKHTTPLKSDSKISGGVVSRERQKLEALKKKQEHEEEILKKMEEEKKRKQEEQKRKRDERLRRVVEARVKEEKKEEEKKKKIEQKMAQFEEKNDKLRTERQADEKAKKKVALKRQEEQEQKRKLEEEARKKKMEEEKRQQESLAKRKAEEEQARKLAEARKALELKREQERELEKQRRDAAERERIEKEKALALQRAVEKAAREKEQRELQEKRKALEEKRKREEQQRLAAEEQAAKQREAAAKIIATIQTPVDKGAGLNVTMDVEQSAMTPVKNAVTLNVTMDIEKSPQTYNITPKGGNAAVVVSNNSDDYGMDQNSDDSTDDESAPRKTIPSWAEGPNLQQTIIKQYFNPPDLDGYFGVIEPPRLEDIFYKNKPRYFKRTSSAVWYSPPGNGQHF
ncbi:inner centromere protein A [Lampris incognitus]|uniref:inner centromere protein A n=1 Tax=Lampris incognitus TaxID=2546036 RepID=UPI0024B55C3B|nr:inner centromere protein A [Lampris incognitus]